MSKQLKQVINLAKKTGDRIIVFDNSEPDDSFVVMPFKQYENLIGLSSESLTEKKIIDKIESTENNENVNANNSLSNSKNNWKIPQEIKEKSEE
ncbi:MAG TPA: hypothetical protein PLE28_02320 [bacterium]|nr:hypothetical protein [bacterium]